jgi:hypothetical protein
MPLKKINLSEVVAKIIEKKVLTEEEDLVRRAIEFRNISNGGKCVDPKGNVASVSLTVAGNTYTAEAESQQYSSGTTEGHAERIALHNALVKAKLISRGESLSLLERTLENRTIVGQIQSIKIFTERHPCSKQPRNSGTSCFEVFNKLNEALGDIFHMYYYTDINVRQYTERTNDYTAFENVLKQIADQYAGGSTLKTLLSYCSTFEQRTSPPGDRVARVGVETTAQSISGAQAASAEVVAPLRLSMGTEHGARRKRGRDTLGAQPDNDMGQRNTIAGNRGGRNGRNQPQ